MFPVLLFLLFFSIATAYYFNEKRKIRKRLRHEKMQEKQREIIGRLRAKKDSGEGSGHNTKEEKEG